jgi:hypothetical protein
MFTIGAIVLSVGLMLFADRKNKEDRPSYDSAPAEDRIWVLVLHLRQDMKAVAFLLAGIIVMLGIIADRIH